jgi:hypothetical protein
MSAACGVCKAMTVATDEDIDRKCCGIPGLVYCRECKENEDAVLAAEGFGDCTLNVPGFELEKKL